MQSMWHTNVPSCMIAHSHSPSVQKNIPQFRNCLHIFNQALLSLNFTSWPSQCHWWCRQCTWVFISGCWVVLSRHLHCTIHCQLLIEFLFQQIGINIYCMFRRTVPPNGSSVAAYDVAIICLDFIRSRCNFAQYCGSHSPLAGTIFLNSHPVLWFQWS